METLKELSGLTTGNLLDMAVDLADYLADKYLTNTEEHPYFVYKFKFMLAFDLLDYLKNSYFKNSIAVEDLDDLLRRVWKEIEGIKREIFEDWKSGKLYKDRKVDRRKIKHFHDKLYYDLVSKLPYSSEENEKRVKKILNLK